MVGSRFTLAARGFAAALALGLSVSAQTPPAPSVSTGVAAPTQPNILWIVSEDNGPQLGAYGDQYATTPNLDKLAARGFRYRTTWSNGPVCGAARTGLIAGVYPESDGGEHMRSLVRLPAFMRMYPALLRDAGYYTSNNAKTDYNLVEAGTVWDASSEPGNAGPPGQFQAAFMPSR